MKKKLISILVGTAMVTTMLSGCGSKADVGAPAADSTDQAATVTEGAAEASGSEEGAVDQNDDGTVNNPEAVEVVEGNLTFWSLFSGGDGEWFNSIVDDYNNTQSPSHPVTSIMLVWDDYYTKLQTAVATNNGPDIGVSHVSKLYELAETGVVQPMDDYLNQLGINLADYYAQASIDAVTIDGQVYAIPLDTHSEVMYYNLDVLEQAGVSEEDVKNIKSAADFEAILAKCKDGLPEDYTALSITNNGDDPFRVWYATYFQMGGSEFVNDGATENTLDEAKAKEAMDWVKSLYTNGYILPGIDDHSAYFQSGKAAFEFGGTWVTGTFNETEGLNFNVAPFPQLFGDNQACWSDSHTLILPTDKDRTEDESLEAVRFLFYASNDGGITWAGSGQIPSSSTANQSDAYKEMKGYNVVDELKYSKYAPKATHYYGGMKADMTNALNGYWQDITDFDTSYAALAQAIEDNLD